MLHNRSFLIGALAGFSLALMGVSFASCQSKEKDITEEVRPAPGVPTQSDDELKIPLAQVDDVIITVGEFQERINRQSPYIRARYTSLEQKKEFLDTLIRFEVLAKEANKRGYDKDPEVVRTMKQVMIQKLMKAEFENKIKPEDISEDEMKAFYKKHENEYNKPEEVRASAIILNSKAQADKVAKDALGAKGSTNKGFRDLVSQHSDDEDTKIRGGDLRYFNRQSPDVPKPVIDAAFGLAKTGDVAGPISADGKFYVIKQTGKRKALSKGFDEVKRQIQNRIYRNKRTKSQKDFIGNLKKNAKIKIHDDQLGKVRVDTSTQGANPRGGHGSAPAFPGNPPGAPKQPNHQH